MKHHYAPWSSDRTPLQGFAKLLVAEGEEHSRCTRCDVFVVCKRPGGYKFWAGGELVRKVPPCTPKPTL